MPSFPRPGEEPTDGRRTAVTDEKLLMNGWAYWPSEEQLATVMDDNQRHFRAAESSTMPLEESRPQVPPPAGPGPVAAVASAAGGRFGEDATVPAPATPAPPAPTSAPTASSPTPPAPAADALPSPARGTAGRLLDLGKRGWQLARKLASGAAKFVREHPDMVAGAAIGAYLGAAGGPLGVVAGALVGAAAGAGVRAYLQRSSESRRAGQGSAQGVAQTTTATADVAPAPRRTTYPARTRSAVADLSRSRSQRLGGPVSAEASRPGQAVSTRVASSAALRASGTDRAAPSAPSRDSVTGPAAASAAQDVRRRRSM
ncbi:hypothetical protein [Streptomyces sp. NPDC127119]|uniref:hypothetical protein n=1 Tax=Streptomyces sp. NPDC127119 TaxID=3345370 RepID=UPI0036420B1A